MRPTSCQAAGQLLIACLLSISALADVAPVGVRVPESTAWTGQRLAVFVDLRTQGSFGGATAFSLPQIPGCFLFKPGSATVSSREIEGETWFVQTHEFAFYSQKSGTLEIPPFEVRFGSRDGFTGPVTDRKETVPATTVTINRPPGTETSGFLVTTDSFEVSEQWQPAPGPAQQGAVFKRTIIQRANNVPGMALAPAPGTAPDGMRIYPPDVQTNDTSDRGDLRGERRETLTYLAQEPGTHTLPALTWQWWNPHTQKLESKTLPAVTFEIAAAPSAATPAARATGGRRAWLWLIAALAVAIAGIALRRRIGAWLARLKQWLRPPDRVAARQLLRACRGHDARAAHEAWTAWCEATSFSPTADHPGGDDALHRAVLELQRHLFGPEPGAAWQPELLDRAFRARLARKSRYSQPDKSAGLPPLNPGLPAPHVF